jgi:hypothetical protein
VLVLGFLFLAWLSLLAILALAPDVYDQSLHVSSAGDASTAELLFVGAISAFILLVAVGVARRWRWMFWLLLIAFLFGVLRVPTSILQLAGWIPSTGPVWYEMFQALIGVVQFVIGLVLVVEYRRHGVWGRPNPGE